MKQHLAASLLNEFHMNVLERTGVHRALINMIDNRQVSFLAMYAEKRGKNIRQAHGRL